MSKDSGNVLGCFQTNLSFAEGSGKKNNNWVFGLKAACPSLLHGRVGLSQDPPIQTGSRPRADLEQSGMLICRQA